MSAVKITILYIFCFAVGFGGMSAYIYFAPTAMPLDNMSGKRVPFDNASGDKMMEDDKMSDKEDSSDSQYTFSAPTFNFQVTFPEEYTVSETHEAGYTQFFISTSQSEGVYIQAYLRTSSNDPSDESLQDRYTREERIIDGYKASIYDLSTGEASLPEGQAAYWVRFSEYPLYWTKGNIIYIRGKIDSVEAVLDSISLADIELDTSTSGWQTYSGQISDLTFLYPPEWFVEANEDETEFYIARTDWDDADWSIRVLDVQGYDDPQKTIAFMAGDLFDNIPSVQVETQDMVINGKDVVKATYSDPSGEYDRLENSPMNVYFFIHNGQAYMALPRSVDYRFDLFAENISFN